MGHPNMEKAAGPPRRTGADALIGAVSAHGVRRLFALPGAQIDQLFCSLYDRSGEIELIVSRHEQGAAYMALGAARSTGEPAAYAVVPGPGWLNASGALATAYGCNAPVLCLCGQIPSASIGRGIGELHELPDQLAMARGLTKWAHRVEQPAQAPAAVAEAFRQMREGRPRPTHIEMALDVMARQDDVPFTPVRPAAAPPEPDAENVEAAARLIASSREPLIFVGSGAQGAAAEIRTLAARLQAPIVAMRSGRGVADERGSLSQPWAAGHALWARADVVLAIGTRLDFPRRMWGEAGLSIVRIDIDPAEIDRISRPSVALVADAKRAVAALLAALPSRQRPSRETELAARKTETIATFDRTMTPQMRYLRAIRAALPEDGFFVDELTQVGYASWSYFPTSLPRHFISSGYQGTLGYGFPTALGVKAANRDRAVVSVSGDGGFMFAAQELATAVQFGLGIVSIVFNDGRFGNVARIQRERYAGKIIGSSLHNPDFVSFAESFGARAVRCGDADALERAVAAGLASGRPTLIEVPVGEMPSPWQHIVLPRNRG